MPGRTIKTDGPHPVDVHVGKRVRTRRTLLGMNQEKLGNAIGIRFQQLQNNERGANRIGASRLFELSQILDVPVSYFFEEMPAKINNLSRGAVPRDEFDPMTKRETLEFVRAYYRISNPAIREKIKGLAKSLARA